MPMKKAERDQATLPSVVPRSCAMALKPGRYMSMENGLKAVREPRIRMRKKYFFLVMIIMVKDNTMQR
jgi:hypothetical protein